MITGSFRSGGAGTLAPLAAVPAAAPAAVPAAVAAAAAAGSNPQINLASFSGDQE